MFVLGEKNIYEIFRNYLKVDKYNKVESYNKHTVQNNSNKESGHLTPNDD